MGEGSKIQWTDATWNPTRGCARVSAGCEHCYAEQVAHRFSGEGQPYEGLTVNMGKGPRWTGEVRLVPEKLAEPLRWRKPRRVFVDSMSDLFHEQVPDEYIAAVFGVMSATPQHTYQVLTKRPERAREWFEWVSGSRHQPERCETVALRHLEEMGVDTKGGFAQGSDAWPLPNVWLGTSVENQPTADARIPHLLQCPAAVRFVSYEPALGPVDFTSIRLRRLASGELNDVHDVLTGRFGFWSDRWHVEDTPRLSWIIVGGESGPGARPFDIAWARDVIAQCREAGVPVFVKQLGARPHHRDTSLGDAWSWKLRDRKGGSPEEWPEDLRVREWPEVDDG